MASFIKGKVVVSNFQILPHRVLSTTPAISRNGNFKLFKNRTLKELYYKSMKIFTYKLLRRKHNYIFPHILVPFKAVGDCTRQFWLQDEGIWGVRQTQSRTGENQSKTCTRVKGR